MLDTNWRGTMVALAVLSLSLTCEVRAEGEGTEPAVTETGADAGTAAATATDAATGAAAGGASEASPESTPEGSAELAPMPREEAPHTLDELANESEEAASATELVSAETEPAPAPESPKGEEDAEKARMMKEAATRKKVLEGVLAMLHNDDTIAQTNPEVIKNLKLWTDTFQQDWKYEASWANRSDEEVAKLAKERYGELAVDLLKTKGNPAEFKQLLAETAIDGVFKMGADLNKAFNNRDEMNSNFAFYDHVRRVMESAPRPGRGGAATPAASNEVRTFVAANRPLLERVTGVPAPRPNAKGQFDDGEVENYLKHHAVELYAHTSFLREKTKEGGFPLGIRKAWGSENYKYRPDYWRNLVRPQLMQDWKSASDTLHTLKSSSR